MDGIKDSFVEALNKEFTDLESATSENKGKIISNIDTLSGNYVDILKEEHNHEERMERLKMEQNQYDDSILDHRDEMEIKQKELDEKKKTRLWNAGITIGSTVLGGILTLLMTAGMYKFEEEHSFTSSVRNGIQKYIFELPKKKK